MCHIKTLAAYQGTSSGWSLDIPRNMISKDIFRASLHMSTKQESLKSGEISQTSRHSRQVRTVPSPSKLLQAGELIIELFAGALQENPVIAPGAITSINF